MKYSVEGTAYDSHAAALAAATAISSTQNRAVKIETGDTTLGNSMSSETVGLAPELVDANELLEPVDRTERLALRNTAQPGTDPVPLQEE